MTEKIYRELDLTETEKAYLAGFIDGEGCISLTNSRSKKSGYLHWRLQMCITQADKNWIEKWVKRTGLGYVHSPKSGNKSLPEKYSNNCQQIYNWWLTDKAAIILIKTLFDYFDLKKSVAEEALKYSRTTSRKMYSGKKGRPGHGVPIHVTQYREEIRRAIMALNSPGKEEKSIITVEQEDEDCQLAFDL